MKIVQIDGIKGLITAVVIGACLFAGFVVFPGVVAMSLWNKYLAASYMFPVLNLFQGVLLWGIAAISYCILSKNELAVSFKNTPELSEEELNKILQSAKFYSNIPLINSNSIRKIHKIDISELKDSENNASYMSSPISTSEKTVKTEQSEEEKLSEMK